MFLTLLFTFFLWNLPHQRRWGYKIFFQISLSYLPLFQKCGGVGDDEDQKLRFNQIQEHAKLNNPYYHLQISTGLITRSRVRKLKGSLSGLVQDISTYQTNFKIDLELDFVLNLIWADAGFNERVLGHKQFNISCMTTFNLSLNRLFWTKIEFWIVTIILDKF